MSEKNLCYIGKIIAMDSIPNADFIACATVRMATGKWRCSID